MEIRKIAVIGAGILGREIARAGLVGGYSVVMEDVLEARREEAFAWIRKSVGVEAGKLLSTASTVEDAIRDADLIVEVTAEELEMKMELFTIFDKFAKPGAIFASASSLSVSEMSELTVIRERCVGMRFGEAPIKRLTVVKTAITSEETVRACVEVGQRIGLQVTITEEGTG